MSSLRKSNQIAKKIRINYGGRFKNIVSNQILKKKLIRYRRFVFKKKYCSRRKCFPEKISWTAYNERYNKIKIERKSESNN